MVSDPALSLVYVHVTVPPATKLIVAVPVARSVTNVDAAVLSLHVRFVEVQPAGPGISEIV